MRDLTTEEQFEFLKAHAADDPWIKEIVGHLDAARQLHADADERIKRAQEQLDHATALDNDSRRYNWGTRVLFLSYAGFIILKLFVDILTAAYR